jgi:UDP-glucose 4-epimerase
MILVTGGAGFIGSHFVRRLQELGRDCAVFDSLEKGHADAVGGAELIQGDLRRPEEVDQAFAGRRIEAVVHFAAYIVVPESVDRPEMYWENNFQGTKNLLDAMERHGVGQIVFSSTAAVYGNPESERIGEDHPRRPINPYGETKSAAEDEMRSRPGIRTVCLRYFNACGAHPSGELCERHDPETHLIPLAIWAAAGRRPALRLFGTDYPTPDGTCIRDYVHVCDLAEAHVLALDHLGSGGGNRAYNCGSGAGFSVREVAEAVERVIGAPLPMEEAPRREGDPARLVADSFRLREELGWSPKRESLDLIVEDAWRAFQARGLA